MQVKLLGKLNNSHRLKFAYIFLEANFHHTSSTKVKTNILASSNDRPPKTSSIGRNWFIFTFLCIHIYAKNNLKFLLKSHFQPMEYTYQLFDKQLLTCFLAHIWRMYIL
jgi:hypothetical protein